MANWLKGLDQLLRGEATRPQLLKQGRIDVPVGGMIVVVVILAMLYGVCMGSYSVFRVADPRIAESPWYMQLIATTLKVPLLYFLTLAVTFPSLYVFNALVGSRLTMVSVLRLLIASLAVNVAVLASLGPIVAFFSVSTESYPFMVLFNVLMFSVAGVLGLIFLLQTLNRLAVRFEAATPPPDAMSSSPEAQQLAAAGRVEANKPADEPGALDAIKGHMLGRHVKIVFRCWMIVFALVGAQMGWVLRPFIGSPQRPFEWLRPRESNFFEAVFQTLTKLLTGTG